MINKIIVAINFIIIIIIVKNEKKATKGKKILIIE